MITLDSFKELIVVLAIAATIFHLAKPVALQFMGAEDFARRRLLWFALTIVAFMVTSLWLFALAAVPLYLWAGRKDSNPVALYLLMMQVVPAVWVDIPFLGNNGLFPLDNYRMLALAVLLPVAIRYRRNSGDAVPGTFGAMDVLLLIFGALQVALYTPPDLRSHLVIPDSPTNALRRAFLFLLDVYLLYFVLSRTCQSRRKMQDAMATLCLACAVMAAIAIFEHARGWLLYVGIASRWGDPTAGFYLLRAGAVRAQASAGHSISLGCLLAVAFGFWLYLQSQVRSAMRRIGAVLLLWGGLFAAFSRGALLGAAAVYFAFMAAGPRALSRLARGAFVALALGGLLALTPIGERVLDELPTAGQAADPYRERLAERGWQLVFAHPYFGDQFPWPEMEDLRQGEGIIDIVNTYLGTALSYGLVGLFVFVSFMLLATTRTYSRSRELAVADPDLALLGTSLVASILGLLLMISTSSFILACQKMFYVLAGLATAYAQLASARLHEPVAPTAVAPLRE